MAKILNMGIGAFGIHSLPKRDKDGKVDRSTIQYFHLPPAAVDPTDKEGRLVPGKGEIPDELLADLRKNDQFTKGLFDSKRLLIDDSAPVAEETKAADKDPSKGK